jgi:hypothetical protein
MLALARFRSVAHSALSLRAAASLLLVVAIGADLAADSRCHPGPRVEEATTVRASGAESSDDPCAGGCVPDCYCCSVLTATSIFRVPPADRPLVALLVTVDPARAPGVVPAPYHPPLAPA